jgi:hypothetical protein
VRQPYGLLRALGWITGQTGAPAASVKATMTGIEASSGARSSSLTVRLKRQFVKLFSFAEPGFSFLPRLAVQAILPPLVFMWLTKFATGPRALRTPSLVMAHDHLLRPPAAW